MLALSGFGASVEAGPTTTPTTAGRKIIAYGWDWPNTAYVRKNVRVMERQPFDGAVIAVSKYREPTVNGETIGIRMFKRERLVPDDYEHAIEDLKATKFECFTDNFIQTETMPGDIDFFSDDEWDIICRNFKAMARVAKQGGCVGLMIDPEEYDGDCVWTPSKWPATRTRGRSGEQYITRAKQRGAQLMHAINSEFPRVKLLFLLGPSYTYVHIVNGSDRYRLLGALIEGMCGAADEGTQIIDGFEQSYGYRTDAAFALGRREMLGAREMFADTDAFDRVMRVGFGLDLDEDMGKEGKFAIDSNIVREKMPAKQTAVNAALRQSDEYVWTWHGNFNGWENGFPYAEAFRAGRDGPGKLVVRRLPLTDPRVVLAAKAEQQDPVDDRAVAAATARGGAVLMQLPNGDWEFRIDPDDRGVAEKWYRTDVDAQSFSKIRIDQFWEQQGWDYDGAAWYRRRFDVPVVPTGKKLLLAVGAADEVARVWLNGEPVGGQDVGEAGWNRSFFLDVSGKLHAGENVIVIRVFDRSGPGGLWRPIRILATN